MNNFSLKSFPCKVMLAIPPQDQDKNLFEYSTPNLGIGYVGSSLKREGHEIKIFDCSLYEDWAAKLAKMLNDFDPDVIGITGFSFQYMNILDLARFIKSKKPESIIVLGGPHASVMAQMVINKDIEIDFVISGEGEESFPAFLKSLNGQTPFASVNGLVYRNNGKIETNPAKAIDKLDDLSYPWDIINPLDYQKGQVHGFIAKRRPITQVVSSRGCPYQCTFCAARTIHGSKIRMRDPKRFVDELELLVKKYGIKDIQVIDDNFTFYREHAIEVCNEIIVRKLDITWSLPNGVRADKLDEELLKFMKKAGCYYMAFGIEFGSPKILKLCKKALDLDSAKATIRLANRLGFITQGFFLMGYPFETLEDIKMTASFINEVPLDKVLIGMPFPYPGTGLFDYYLENRYHNISSIDWENFREHGFKRIFENLTQDQVKLERKKAYLRFYLNPVNFIRFLLKFRTWVQFKTAWQGFKLLARLAAGGQ